MRVFKFLTLLILVIILSITTQIGGVILLVSYLLFRKNKAKYIGSFFLLYALSTFVLVPLIAPYFGREKIQTNDRVKMHMFFTVLTNRNYVVPQINILLGDVSRNMEQSYPGLELHCLDANFPFWDGFPLLPHLSHKDGKRLDISLVYHDDKGEVVNTKPSRSGYGVFEEPLSSEYNQIEVCKNKGYWQYDFPKYLTLGKTRPALGFSNKATRKLLQKILEQAQIAKVFIEPHLRSRMNLAHPKLRYHGCQAVRHDDHIHLQVK